MIPARQVFDEYAGDYDRWFDEHAEVYREQVRLLRDAVSQTGRGLEVGVGSGRFAVLPGIRYGIDPARNLLKMANARGIEIVQGEGEHLPFRTGTFDQVLMMTVICFLENQCGALKESFRVLVNRGVLVLGFIEKDEEIARKYQQEKIKGRFLRFARFLSADEVTRCLNSAGFSDISVLWRSQGFCIIKGWKKKFPGIERVILSGREIQLNGYQQFLLVLRSIPRERENPAN